MFFVQIIMSMTLMFSMNSFKRIVSVKNGLKENVSEGIKDLFDPFGYRLLIVNISYFVVPFIPVIVSMILMKSKYAPIVYLVLFTLVFVYFSMFLALLFKMVSNKVLRFLNYFAIACILGLIVGASIIRLPGCHIPMKYSMMLFEGYVYLIFFYILLSSIFALVMSMLSSQVMNHKSDFLSGKFPMNKKTRIYNFLIKTFIDKEKVLGILK